MNKIIYEKMPCPNTDVLKKKKGQKSWGLARTGSSRGPHFWTLTNLAVFYHCATVNECIHSIQRTEIYRKPYKPLKKNFFFDPKFSKNHVFEDFLKNIVLNEGLKVCLNESAQNLPLEDYNHDGESDKKKIFAQAPPPGPTVGQIWPKSRSNIDFYQYLWCWVFSDSELQGEHNAHSGESQKSILTELVLGR